MILIKINFLGWFDKMWVIITLAQMRISHVYCTIYIS